MNIAHGYLVSLVIFLSLTGCNIQRSTWRRNVPVPSHLYSYSNVPINEAIREQGVAYDAVSDVHRNGSGNLILVHENNMLASGPDRSKRIYVFSKESGMTPRVVVPPDKASSYWLDDNAELLAWTQGDDTIHFADGRQFRLGPDRGYLVGFDHGGRFMYVYHSAKKSTSIYRTSSLEEPVAQFDADRVPIELYVRGDRLLVCGNIRAGRMTAINRREDSIRELRTFELKNGSFVEAPSIPIPRRGHVVDVDPWSDLVFVRQYRDLPFSDQYFLLNMRSGEITKLGSLRQGFYRFLAEDVLGGDRLASFKGR